MIGRGLLALVLGLWAGGAMACETVTFRDQPYLICEAGPGSDVRLFLDDGEGSVLGSFGAVDGLLATEGAHLRFAMNAGMYHPDRRPVGLYIENGEERAPLIRRARGGNFGLLPNGVFCVLEGGGFRVIETEAYAAAPPDCRFASQSGPMLVIDGKLHPRFLADATSRHVRNGVGTSADGTRAVFAISQAPVTFHEFASLFRDYLKLPQALYFDGSVSRLYEPAAGRVGFGLPLGPIVGLVDAGPRGQ